MILGGLVGVVIHGKDDVGSSFMNLQAEVRRGVVTGLENNLLEDKARLHEDRSRVGMCFDGFRGTRGTSNKANPR